MTKSSAGRQVEVCEWVFKFQYTTAFNFSVEISRLRALLFSQAFAASFDPARHFTEQQKSKRIETVGQYEYNPKGIMGEGSYATVFGATHVPTGKSVILKRIHLQDNTELTVPMIRECHINLDLKHPNILRMERVLVRGSFLYLVLEPMNCDMREHFAMYDHKYENPGMKKKFMKSLLSGLAYCHSCNILHRDIKPENLLISGDVLKIADFGSARGFIADSSTSDSPSLTPAVVSVEYRAPEVLLGSTAYSKAIDIWAAGCVFGEMWLLKPLFGCAENVGDGSNEVLEKIFRVLGTPEKESWPGLSDLKFPEDLRFPEEAPTGLGVLVPRLEDDPAGKDLLSKLLCLNPEGRISAEEALEHEYFTV